jgi:hypothetical protein
MSATAIGDVVVCTPASTMMDAAFRWGLAGTTAGNDSVAMIRTPSVVLDWQGQRPVTAGMTCRPFGEIDVRGCGK